MTHGIKDIIKFLKTALGVVLVVLCLCSCGTSKGDVNATYVKGADDTPATEQELQEQQRSCWQAQFLGLFYDVMAASSMKAYPKVTGSAMPFMMVAFAVWLSIRLLRHVSSVVEESPAEVWTEITRMAFVCLCCGLIASQTGFLLFILNKVVFPIYYAFLEYGSRILTALTSNGDVNSPGIYIGEPGKGVCLIYTNSLMCTFDASAMAEAKSGSFPTGPSDLMQCLTCSVSDRLQMGFAIAKNLLGMSKFSAVVCGIVVYAIFLIVKFAFVFYIVDSLFRMNLAVILLPCFVLGYPFKFSRKWTKTGFLMMINSAAILAFMAIISAMTMLAMQIMIENNSAMLGNRDMYTEFGITALTLLLISFLVLKSISTAVTLANSIVGGGGSTDFQKKIGKLAAEVGKKAATWVTGGVAKMFTKTSVGQRLKEHKEHFEEGLKHMAGRDEPDE